MIGQGREKPYLRLARKLAIADHVRFLGATEEVPLYLSGADFVLQPSRTENTGNAIVESLVAGVPVLATEACGFAMHVARSGAGKIIPCSPFRQETMNSILQELLLAPSRKEWQRQAVSYADTTDLYNRVAVIVDLIEALGAKKKTGRAA
ncbi:MAG: glycosyltransferase [Deltaproteobacteria bacterium]|nr:glycosyltransferase [Deltaproteobacteria bacterium]